MQATIVSISSKCPGWTTQIQLYSKPSIKLNPCFVFILLHRTNLIPTKQPVQRGNSVSPTGLRRLEWRWILFSICGQISKHLFDTVSRAEQKDRERERAMFLFQIILSWGTFLLSASNSVPPLSRAAVTFSRHCGGRKRGKGPLKEWLKAGG